MVTSSKCFVSSTYYFKWSTCSIFSCSHTRSERERERERERESTIGGFSSWWFTLGLVIMIHGFMLGVPRSHEKHETKSWNEREREREREREASLVGCTDQWVTECTWFVEEEATRFHPCFCSPCLVSALYLPQGASQSIALDASLVICIVLTSLYQCPVARVTEKKKRSVESYSLFRVYIIPYHNIILTVYSGEKEVKLIPFTPWPFIDDFTWWEEERMRVIHTQSTS